MEYLLYQAATQREAIKLAKDEHDALARRILPQGKSPADGKPMVTTRLYDIEIVPSLPEARAPVDPEVRKHLTDARRLALKREADLDPKWREKDADGNELVRTVEESDEIAPTREIIL